MQQQEDSQTFMETKNKLKSGDKVWLVRVTKKLPKLYGSVVTETKNVICNEKSEYQFGSMGSYTTSIHKKELSFMRSYGYIKYPYSKNFEFNVVGIKFFKHHIAYAPELTHKEIYLFNKEEYPRSIDDQYWYLNTINSMLDVKKFLYCWCDTKNHEHFIENFKTYDINLSNFHKTEIYVCSNGSLIFLKEEDAILYCKQLLNNAFSSKKDEVQHYYKKITSAIAEKSKLKHALSLFK